MARFVNISQKWFDVPDDCDGAKIKVKYLTPGQEQELELDALNVSGSANAETEISFDINKKRQLIVKRTVSDWSEFYGRDGKESKCNAVNLLKALSEFDWFFELVEKSRNTLRTEVEGEQEEAEKN